MSRIGLEKNATDLSFAVKEFVNTKQGLGKTPMLSYPTLQKLIPEKEAEMKLRMNLLGLFIVTAILLPACSTSAATPEPAMEKGGSGVMTEKEIPEIMLEYEDAEDLMEKEDSEDMEGLEVSDDMIEKDDSDTMIDKDDSGNMMDSEDSDAMKETGDSDDMTETEISGAMMEVPTWFSVNLTDVNSGENLRVADLKD